MSLTKQGSIHIGKPDGEFEPTTRTGKMCEAAGIKIVRKPAKEIALVLMQFRYQSITYPVRQTKTYTRFHFITGNVGRRLEYLVP